MTARTYHPTAIFQPEYACDPDTDELQIRLKLVSRQTTPPVIGGQIGIRDTVGTLEFRYSPPGNTCKLLFRLLCPTVTGQVPQKMDVRVVLADTLVRLP